MAPRAVPAAPAAPHAQRLEQYQVNQILDYFADGLNNSEIQRKTNISRTCIAKIRDNVRVTGQAYPPSMVKQGRPRLLLEEQEQWVMQYLRDRPTSYYDEIQWFINDEFDIVVSERYVGDLIKRRGFSRKKAQRVAEEACQELRDDWRERQRTMPAHRVCVVDESANNERTGWRKYGYSPVGTPCKDKGGAKRSERWSFLPAMVDNGYLPEPLIVQGAITSEAFELWLEYNVIPHLDRGSFLVMDNASIHRSERVKQLCEQAGIRLEYLPPYSPDFNPIELSFNVFKQWVKRNIQDAGCFSTFGDFLRHGALTANINTHAAAWFWQCGYP